MGVCSSCLGRGKENDGYDEDDETRLLFDDPSAVQYGSFHDQSVHGSDNPGESQRENEALQRVVAKTSDNMVDIFEIIPRNHSRAGPTLFSYAGQETKIVRYQHLLTKLAPKNENADRLPPGIQVDWLLQDDTSAPEPDLRPVTKDSDEPLVGTFADAAAAMS